MASVPQSSWVCSLNPINGVSSTKTNLFSPKNPQFKPLKISFSSTQFISAQSSSNSPDTSSEAEPGSVDPVKLAFARAKAYKKSIPLDPIPRIEPNPGPDFDGIGVANGGSGPGSGGVGGGGPEGVPVSVKIAMEKAKKYKKNKGIVGDTKNVGERETVPGSVSVRESE